MGIIAILRLASTPAPHVQKTVGILNGVISESENCQNKICGLLVAGINLIKFKLKSNKLEPSLTMGLMM